MGDPLRASPSFEALLEQIDELPEGTSGEIPEPGILRTMPRPAAAHRRVSRALARALDLVDRGASTRGTWWIEIEPAVRFGLRLFTPDIAAWRIDRVPELPDEVPLSVAPDLCIEILSPTTARYDRTTKLPILWRHGIPKLTPSEAEALQAEIAAEVRAAKRRSRKRRVA